MYCMYPPSDREVTIYNRDFKNKQRLVNSCYILFIKCLTSIKRLLCKSQGEQIAPIYSAIPCSIVLLGSSSRVLNSSIFYFQWPVSNRRVGIDRLDPHEGIIN